MSMSAVRHLHFRASTLMRFSLYGYDALLYLVHLTPEQVIMQIRNDDDYLNLLDKLLLQKYSRIACCT